MKQPDSLNTLFFHNNVKIVKYHIIAELYDEQDVCI